MSADEWSLIEGTYTPDGTTPFEAFIFESNQGGVNVSFYVDDFVVLGEASSSGSSSSSSSSGGAAKNVAVNGDVETATTNWSPRGATIARSTDEKYAGEASLLVSGRSSSWQGASFNAGALTTGNTYQVSAWVKLAAGEPPAGLKITGKRQDDTDSSTYLNTAR